MALEAGGRVKHQHVQFTGGAYVSPVSMKELVAFNRSLGLLRQVVGGCDGAVEVAESVREQVREIVEAAR